MTGKVTELSSESHGAVREKRYDMSTGRHRGNPRIRIAFVRPKRRRRLTSWNF